MGTISGASLNVEDEIGLKIQRVGLDGGTNPGGGINPGLTHMYISYI